MEKDRERGEPASFASSNMQHNVRLRYHMCLWRVSNWIPTCPGLSISELIWGASFRSKPNVGERCEAASSTRNPFPLLVHSLEGHSRNISEALLGRPPFLFGQACNLCV